MTKFLISNANFAVSIPLTALRLAGFWPPDLEDRNKTMYNCYTVFIFMYILGIYITIQIVDLYVIWGDLALMTGDAFLLFTNLAQASKIINLICRKKQIETIINQCNNVLKSQTSIGGKIIVKSCDRETFFLLVLYFCLTLVTTVGWATSAEKNHLPMQAWYPYDTSKYPAFQLTYFHQVSALLMAAFLNVGKDTLVATLIAQCTCRLRLLGLSLRTLCDNLDDNIQPLVKIKSELRNSYVLTRKQKDIVKYRLRLCVREHQDVLETAGELQRCFSEPTFLQFMVSLVIICVTAFQLLSQTGNLVRFFSMGTYLLNMMFQVFLYCYQGSQLTEESSQVSSAAYELPWYACDVRTRRSVLILMTRCQRITKVTALGFTTLSLASFMAIIKASYSLFTLLKQVDEAR